MRTAEDHLEAEVVMNRLPAIPPNIGDAITAIAEICASVRETANRDIDLPRAVALGRIRLRRLVADEAARGDAACVALQDMCAHMLDAFEALAAAMSRSRAEAAQRERHLRDILDRARQALRESALDEADAAIVHAPPAPDPWLTRLTDREREVMGAMISGVTKTNDIADRLTISPTTVKKHVSHILEKLEVVSRHAAVRRAREAGWCAPIAPPAALPPGGQESPAIRIGGSVS